MIRRKLIQHGPSSLTVSLPSEWVKKFFLKKGDSVDFFIIDDGLLIKPIDASKPVKKTEIDLSGFCEESISDFLISLYKKGYDKVNITYDQDSILKNIYSNLKDSKSGFDIIHQTTNCVELENTSNPDDTFDNLFRRIFRMLFEFSIKIKQHLESGTELTETSLFYKSSISKFSNFCKRIVVRENNTNSSFIYSIIEGLEMISQNMNFIFDAYKISEHTITNDFINYFNNIIESIDEIHKLYYSFSYNSYCDLKKKLLSMEELLSTSCDDSSHPCYWEYARVINDRLRCILKTIIDLNI